MPTSTARPSPRELSQQTVCYWGCYANAALMRRIWAIGVGMVQRESNLLGVATNWGAPVEPGTNTKWTSEVFYPIQRTDHLQVTPAVQITRDPAFNLLKKTIFVGSVLRMRLAF
jgi:hypothetical protein